MVQVDVGHGRDVDARRLDDVDGVDTDARTNMAGRCASFWVCGSDDGGDDAPILVPSLWRYRQAVCGSSDEHLGRLKRSRVWIILVWAVFGRRPFLRRVAAAIELQQPVVARAVPIAIGPWASSRSLQYCVEARHLPDRDAPGPHRTLPGELERMATRTALGFTARAAVEADGNLLVIGIMDLRARCRRGGDNRRTPRTGR